MDCGWDWVRLALRRVRWGDLLRRAVADAACVLDQMSDKIEYGVVRERFFKAVNDHPENIDLIAHNAAAVLMKGTAWPESFSVEQVSIAIEAFFLEFWRRWELAQGLRSRER